MLKPTSLPNNFNALALADVLLEWEKITNFSTAEEYDEAAERAIRMIARDYALLAAAIEKEVESGLYAGRD
jgi:hypothetical protein